jgi:ATP-binding cassette subfamily C exporter for protease/lipase
MAMKPSSLLQRSELSATLYLFRRELFVCLIFTIVVNVLMLTPTLYMLQLFDRVMISQNELTLIAFTLAMLLLLAVMAFAEWSRALLLVRIGVKLDERLNSRVFNASFESHLQQLGANPSQAFSDLTTVRQFLTGAGLFAFMDAPWTPIYMVVLYLLHPLLGLLSVIFTLLIVMVAFVSHRLTYKTIDAALEAGAHAQSFVQGKLRNGEVIEAMGMLGALRSRWQARHRRHLALQGKAQDMAVRVETFTKFLRYTQQSLTLAAGAILVVHGELSPGAMIAANMLMGRASQPIEQIVSTWKSFLSARKSFGRLDALLARHPTRDLGLVHSVLRGHVRVEALQACAPGRAAPILKGLSADFPAGTVVAIIGPSGSGKSTLARALVGIWPDVEGEVLIDDVPIQSWSRAALGPYLGYLPQDIELFEGTIAENISRFGEIDSAKVIRAAERAGVHQMILRFPRGYDTPIGEAGNLLSGGQRQRIGLARAMYGDPSVIVLDEPNANLDDVGETALVKAVQELKTQGKTVFLITHRMSVFGVADRILVLRDGAIALYGPTMDVITAMQSQYREVVDIHAAPAAQPN